MVLHSKPLLISLIWFTLSAPSLKAMAVTGTDSTVVSDSTVMSDSTVVAADSISMAEIDSKVTQYIANWEEQQQGRWFCGFTISADILNPILYLASDYGGVEGAIRLNLKNTYFPIVEIGMGKGDITDDDTGITYKTTAPYFRIGCDINMLKNKLQDNRLYAGVRYGLSSFTYDLGGPNLTDPVWGGERPFSYEGVKSTCHWAEIVLGVQVKVWRNFHMGWSLRFRKEISFEESRYAKPYYIPGYGTTTDSSCWGGTYNLIFDLNWGKKKTRESNSHAYSH